MNNRLLIAVIVLLVVFGVFYILLNAFTKSQGLKIEKQQAQQSVIYQTITPQTSQTVQVQMVNTTAMWKAGVPTRVSVDFVTAPHPVPRAVDLLIQFDPAAVSVTNVLPGNLWSGTNVLRKQIDNDKGELRFTIGQGLKEEATSNRIIATIEFKAKSSYKGTSIIRFAQGSLLLKPEENTTVSMQGTPITVSIGN